MDQNSSDLAAALGGSPVQPIPAPGPAATSLDPSLAQPPVQVAETPVPGQVGPVQVPQQVPQQIPQQIPQQPVQQQPVPQPVQPPIQQVAPNAPGTQAFVNPDPSQGINEPVVIDPATGQPVPVIAPANQPAPISPQAEAQAQQQQELAEPATVSELAECANVLRSVLPAGAGPKVAALLDRVAESRIQADAAQQAQVPQQLQQQPQGPFITQ